MLDKIIDRLAVIAERNQTAITMGGAIWFWLGIAIYARFIELPYVPDVLRSAFFWTSVGANALWWGYFYGAIQARRSALCEEKKPDEISDGG